MGKCNQLTPLPFKGLKQSTACTYRMKTTMTTNEKTTMMAAHRGKMIHNGTVSPSTSVGLDSTPAGRASDCGVSRTREVLIGCENADETDH